MNGIVYKDREVTQPAGRPGALDIESFLAFVPNAFFTAPDAFWPPIYA